MAEVVEAARAAVEGEDMIPDLEDSRDPLLAEGLPLEVLRHAGKLTLMSPVVAAEGDETLAEAGPGPPPDRNLVPCLGRTHRQDLVTLVALDHGPN